MTAEEMLAELAALAEQAKKPDGFATMEELIAAAPEGTSEYAVRKLVKRARRDGRLFATRVPRENVEGATQRVIAYRILPV